MVIVEVNMSVVEFLDISNLFSNNYFFKIDNGVFNFNALRNIFIKHFFFFLSVLFGHEYILE